jgi:hypothetical protein
MAFIIEGKLYSEACTDCRNPLVHSKIKFYRVEATREVYAELAANTKDTLRVVSAEEVKSLDGQLVGEAKLDETGHYLAKLDRYTEGPLRIVAEIDAPDGGKSERGPVLVYLTTILPNWQYSQDQQSARFQWDYIIPKAFWCRLLEWFDLWVICGRITICQSKDVPARGVKVKAMDADVITDDVLGTATTNSDGRFTIYYHSIDFKRTFLSWIGINVETPFGGTLGPDVYFVVEAADGTSLLKETRSDGKKPGRKDVGHCACFSFCVELPIPPGAAPIDPIWNKVGIAFPISTESNPHAFDDEGYADAGLRKYAIWSQTSLNGQVPDPTRADCPLYRFRIARSTRGNTNAAAPVAEFDSPNAAIVGGSLGEFGAGLFVPGANLGTLYTWKAFPFFQYISIGVTMAPEDVDAQGWVDVIKAAKRALDLDNARRISLGLAAISTTVSDYNWANDGNQLMMINTVSLSVGEAPVGPVGLEIGDEFPVGNRFSIPKVAIRFETKDRVTGDPRPGNGITLNAMVVSNAAPHYTLALKRGNNFVGDCVAFSKEDVNVAYTVYHSHLGSATLTARSADGTFNAWPSGGAPVTNPNNQLVLVDNVPRPGIDEVHNSLVTITPRPDHTCVYIVSLNIVLLRHNGYSSEWRSPQQKYFYYEA